MGLDRKDTQCANMHRWFSIMESEWNESEIFPGPLPKRGLIPPSSQELNLGRREVRLCKIECNFHPMKIFIGIATLGNELRPIFVYLPNLKKKKQVAVHRRMNSLSNLLFGRVELAIRSGDLLH